MAHREAAGANADEEQRAESARLSCNLSIALTDRQLTAECPDVFRVDLARSLSNLGQILDALHRPAEAAEAVREATSLYRELASERPEVFGDLLAETMETLGGNKAHHAGKPELTGEVVVNKDVG